MQVFPVSSFSPELREFHQLWSLEIGVVNFVCVQPIIEQNKNFRIDISEFQELAFTF
jgi:hypothetical protein